MPTFTESKAEPEQGAVSAGRRWNLSGGTWTQGTDPFRALKWHCWGSEHFCGSKNPKPQRNELVVMSFPQQRFGTVPVGTGRMMPTGVQSWCSECWCVLVPGWEGPGSLRPWTLWVAEFLWEPLSREPAWSATLLHGDSPSGTTELHKQGPVARGWSP